MRTFKYQFISTLLVITFLIGFLPTTSTAANPPEILAFLEAAMNRDKDGNTTVDSKIVELWDEYGEIGAVDPDSFALEDINGDGVSEIYLLSRANMNYGNLYYIEGGKYYTIDHSYNRNRIQKYKHKTDGSIVYLSISVEGVFYHNTSTISVQVADRKKLFTYYAASWSDTKKDKYMVSGQEVSEDLYNKAQSTYYQTLTEMEIKYYPLTEAGLVQAGLKSGTAFSKALPIRINSISTSEYVSFAVKQDGTLWAWGENGVGQYGNEKTESSYVPIQVMTGVAAVKTNGSNTFVIKQDGSLWGFGDNNMWELANGTQKRTITPAQILTNVVDVVCSGSHVLALKQDGTVWAWGYNNMGQVGNGSVMTQKTPVQVLDNVLEIAGGGKHSLAVKTDGSLWIWGDHPLNATPGLVANLRNTPQKIMTGIRHVYGAGARTAVVKKDGTFLLWDHLDYTSNADTKPILSVTGVDSAQIGYDHVYLIKPDKTLWGWGVNQYGSIQNLNNEDKYTVRQFMTDVVAAEGAAFASTFALKSDRTLWGWGTNKYGQLGDSTIIDMNLAKEPRIILSNLLLPTQVQTQTATLATATAAKVYIDGKQTTFEAYSIGGNNYFKLRDLAKVISGSKKQFEVTWDGAKAAINLLSGKAYTSVGGELKAGDGKNKTASPSSAKIYKNDVAVSLTVYTINGNNYFKLRDIGQLFNFGVTWDDVKKSIMVTTANGYTAN